MSKPFIHYDIKNGVEYAPVYTPQRINGRKSNDPVYIGRVIDRDRGIYRSRQRGLFTYTIECGYGDVSIDDYPDKLSSESSEERLILDFGDAFCLFTALETCGLAEIVRAALPKQVDTMMSLLGYRLLADASNRYAKDWWEGSYARVLFPNAKLRSQRISEF